MPWRQTLRWSLMSSCPSMPPRSTPVWVHAYTVHTLRLFFVNFYFILYFLYWFLLIKMLILTYTLHICRVSPWRPTLKKKYILSSCVSPSAKVDCRLANSRSIRTVILHLSILRLQIPSIQTTEWWFIYCCILYAIQLNMP